MDICYDWEFFEDGSTIQPISVGMVAADGDELYLICDNPRAISSALNNPWMRDNVIPHLPIEYAVTPRGEYDGSWRWNKFHADMTVIRGVSELQLEVWDFISKHGERAELWANYAAYDHVCLAQLWGKMASLPAGLPMYTNDIQTLITLTGLPTAQLPTQDPASEHYALRDAQHDMAMLQELKKHWQRNF